MSVLALEATLRAAFSGAGVAVVPVADGVFEALPDVERCAVAGAVPARQQEFAAGRMAGARALARLGLKAEPIPMGPDRAPVWPAGVYGSISHAGGFAAAVVSATAPVGLDMEGDAALEPDLWPVLLTQAEMKIAQISENAGVFALEVFVAKEAAYKAQYARSGTLFDFQMLETEWQGSVFLARFTKDCAPFSKGQALGGNISRACGLVIAAVTLLE